MVCRLKKHQVLHKTKYLRQPQALKQKVIVNAEEAGKEDNDSPPGESGSKPKIIKIESIESNRGKESAHDITWLGISTEETTETRSNPATAIAAYRSAHLRRAAARDWWR